MRIACGYLAGRGRLLLLWAAAGGLPATACSSYFKRAALAPPGAASRRMFAWGRRGLAQALDALARNSRAGRGGSMPYRAARAVPGGAISYGFWFAAPGCSPRLYDFLRGEPLARHHSFPTFGTLV